MLTRIKRNALKFKGSEGIPESSSIYRHYSIANRMIHDDLKSTPFKMHAEPVSFKRSDYSDLTFIKYADFFGFYYHSNFSKLNVMGEVAKKNTDIFMLDQDLLVPFHFFRPIVDFTYSRTCTKAGREFLMASSSGRL